MEYDKEKTGVLFSNNQDGNEKRPYYKGKITFDGVEYELAAWVRESAKGNKFLSLKAELPLYEQRRAQEQGRAQEQPVRDGQDVPF